jgi:hypothetical protein
LLYLQQLPLVIALYFGTFYICLHLLLVELQLNFDIVVAYAVLEHIPDEEIDAILDEINRVIKREGFLYVSRLPRKWSIAEKLARVLNISGHEILVDEETFVDKLKDHGFEILQCSRQDMIPGFPPALWNLAFPIALIINRALLKTPLNCLAHNLRIIAQKS